MKFRKSRHFRRQVKFYTINYGFHEPAFLLLDGNFIKVCVEKQMNIKFLFTKYSHLQCIPKVTQCVLNELKLLNTVFPGVFSAAQKYQVVRCGHFKGVQAHQCILDIVKQTPNKDYTKSQNQFYWVFTQDDNLQQELNNIEHAPVGYFQANGNTLTLIEPNEYTKGKVTKESRDKFLPDAHEYKALIPILKQQREERFQKMLQKVKKERAEIQVKIKKPAKGPNPLSVKSKQKQKLCITKSIKKRRHKLKNRRARKSTIKQT